MDINNIDINTDKGFYLIKKSAIINDFEDILRKLKSLKSNDRTEMDRKIAICITEVEKVYSYFQVYIQEIGK